MYPTEDLRVLILGESTLSSLGSCSTNAVDLFAKRTSYNRRISIINTSVVGMTAADALRHVGEFLMQTRVDLIISYLGNCDSSGYGFLKRKSMLDFGGVYPRAVNALLRIRRSHPVPSNPFQFVFFNNPIQPFPASVTVKDFRYFMKRIITIALQKGCMFLLVNPVANNRFPPLNTAQNRLFFRVFSIPEAFSLQADPILPVLMKAQHLLDSKAFDAAVDAYDAIARQTGDQTQRLLALNNGAFARFRNGQMDAAGALLDAAPAGQSPYYSFILYNKASIAETQGDRAGARMLFELAAESDTASFRISGTYRDVLSGLAEAYGQKIGYIDAGKHLTESDFFDYCHPDKNGHAVLFSEIRQYLESAFSLQPGGHVPAIRFHSLNPDRYLGYRSPVFEHFSLVKAADPRFPCTLAAQTTSHSYEELIKRYDDTPSDHAHKSGLRILRHPLFGHPGFIAQSPPVEGIDQARFSEFYFIRHLLSLFLDSSSNTVLNTLSAGLSGIIPNPVRLSIMQRELHAWCAIPEAGTIINMIRSLPHVDLVDRMRLLFSRMLEKEPVITTKYRTITNWFFRESLLFGTVSDALMFCDRSSLFDLATSCAGILLSSNAPGDREQTPFNDLLRDLRTLVSIHTKHLDPGVRGGFNLTGVALASYADELRAFRDSVTHPQATS